MVVNQITVFKLGYCIYLLLSLYLRSSKADNVAAAYFDRCALYILLNYKNYISVRLASQPRNGDEHYAVELDMTGQGNRCFFKVG